MELELLLWNQGNQNTRLVSRLCIHDVVATPAPIFVTFRLINKETGEITLRQSSWYYRDRNGTFIINGGERIIVSKLVRLVFTLMTADKNGKADISVCYP